MSRGLWFPRRRPRSAGILALHDMGTNDAPLGAAYSRRLPLVDELERHPCLSLLSLRQRA